LEGVTTYVEVGPGTVLSGLVRKIDHDATAMSFSGPEDLPAIEALAAHGASAAMSGRPEPARE